MVSTKFIDVKCDLPKQNNTTYFSSAISWYLMNSLTLLRYHGIKSTKTTKIRQKIRKNHATTKIRKPDRDHPSPPPLLHTQPLPKTTNIRHEKNAKLPKSLKNPQTGLSPLPPPTHPLYTREILQTHKNKTKIC